MSKKWRKGIPAPRHQYPVNSHAYFILEDLPSACLELDPDYQRTIQPEHVQNIVDKFEPGLVKALDVSNRDGHYYVFDGGQRLCAMKRIYGENTTFIVPCRVFYGLTKEDEAHFFGKQNGETKAIPYAKLLRSNIISDENQAREFVSAAENLGVAMSIDKRTESSIDAVKKAKWVWDRYGNDIFAETVELIRDTWGPDKRNYCAGMLGSVALFLSEFGKEYDRVRFIKKLSARTVPDLIREARVYRSTYQSQDGAIAMAIAKSYNYGNGRARLEDWRFPGLGVKAAPGQ